MSKVFPKFKQTEYEIVIPDVLNTNTQNTAGEINGRLDSANMPVRTLTYKHFQEPEYNEVASANLTTVEWTGSTQKYKEIRRWNWEHGATPTWSEQLQALDLKTIDWNKGWNDLREYSGWENFELDLDCWEGYLSGQVNIDFHHGLQTIAYSENDTTFYIMIGYAWETQWAVFVNGAMVAETGPLSPYGLNVVIPFGLGVGSGTARITIAWRATTTKDIFSGKYPNDPTTDLELFGATIWARNTRR